MNYAFYLQGSYRNDTNIRGDSDVDVVLELTSSFQHDTDLLSPYDRNALLNSFQPAAYEWNDFRRETLKALESGFGKEMVVQGNKSIKLKKDPPRLAADIVVCLEHRRYTHLNSYVKGMTFWALHAKRWIINYPKEHYRNGAAKSIATSDRYKRTVRMFKNVRNHLESIGWISSNLAPSYFVECFLYNAPDSDFLPGFQDTYHAIVKWMVDNPIDRLVCQNCQQWLFGPSPKQWSVTDARTLANNLVTMWNNWS